VGDDVIHPRPLRAPVGVLERFDVPPGSLRVQAEVRLDAKVQAPTMEEMGGDEGLAEPCGARWYGVGQRSPWGRKDGVGTVSERHSPVARGDRSPGPSTPHGQHRFHLRPRLEAPEPSRKTLRWFHWRRSLYVRRSRYVRCS